MSKLLTASPSRREVLYHGGMGLGSIALSAMLSQEPARAAEALAPRKPHHASKAKNCIFLLMEGGPSHIDTFDPKPKLASLHLTKFQKERNKFEANIDRKSTRLNSSNLVISYAVFCLK